MLDLDEPPHGGHHVTQQRGRTFAALAIVAVVGVIGVWVAGRWTPAVPADAASVVLARTTLVGEVTPDPSEGTDPEALSRGPSGSDCLDPIERPAGPLSLCWEAYREPMDADPSKDHYRLRVFGTFGGESGTGVRWAIARARLVGEPSDQVFQGWPVGVVDGSCDQVEVVFGLSTEPVLETLCGRTTGTTDDADWSHTATWVCVGCLVADHADRAIALEIFVAMPEGVVPTWEIFADLGG
jgi:hypothetical protein